MGCDIHAHAEKREDGKWVRMTILPEAFDNRSYGVFGFIADVRNYSAVPPIAAPRGFPDDASGHVREDYKGWGGDAHTPSWLTLDELLSFDYSKPMENRRYTQQVAPNAFNGGATAEPGAGKMTTFREFLGPWFEQGLQELKDAGAERVVFWFDN